MKRLYGVICTLFVGAILLTLAPPAAAAPVSAQQRCFEQTGHCISGPIRTYWELNGGLPVFGYPITPQQVETVEGRTIPVQWFERDRLEIQNDGTVTAGRLGARLLELQGRPWETFPSGNELYGSRDCVWFNSTRHNVCEPFRSYWENNGGIERFGLPLTEPFYETIEGTELLVQYFERRRMEYHTQLPGQPVLLGLLGVEVRNLEMGQPVGEFAVPQCVVDAVEGDLYASTFLDAYEQVWFRETLGCPLWGVDYRVDASIQNMENGQMMWFQLPELYRTRGELRFIHATVEPDAAFYRYIDTWQEGVDPNTPDMTPPREGLYAPWGGFGKVWEEDARLRSQIGWAIEPQAQATTVSVMTLVDGDLEQDASNVKFLVVLDNSRTVYVFGGADDPSQFEVIRL